MKDNNIVNIYLPDHQIDFLILNFGYDKENDAIPLNNRKDIGLFINSHVSFSSKPVAVEKENCRLLLPVQAELQYKMDSNFVYFQKLDQKLISQCIEAAFKRYVYDYFSFGYSKGYTQSAILNTLFIKLNVKNNAVSLDRLKQMDYRRRKHYQKQVSEDIHNAIYE